MNSLKWKGLGRKIESSCRKALYDYQMIDESGKMAVALSGGKDSLTLLFMLKKILGRGFPDAELFAIHVDGEFTCGAGVNKEFLKKTCDELDVPFIVCESTQRLETLECYRCSRERRSLLFEAAKSVGAHTIAFGHHRDDNAQTLMMNMLQKGEFAGMLPKITMQRYDVTIVRPLIYVSEAEIREFAMQSGFARISCQCPVGQNSRRKQVDRLLDEMDEMFPNARHNLAQASLLYGSDKAKNP
ncbi:MAG: tRNA 2-thiocytidine biosynthesis protein TtcA [Chlamydiae bacterium]|nr:tRNA 2-thiocytidine biosynthesis protein TtcA [Chlamydiota bacterium]